MDEKKKQNEQKIKLLEGGIDTICKTQECNRDTKDIKGIPDLTKKYVKPDLRQFKKSFMSQ